MSVLKDRLIRFTQSSALNDLFELRPFFDALFPENWVFEQLAGKEIDLTQFPIDEYEKQPPHVKEKVSCDQVLALARGVLAQPGAEQYVSALIKTFIKMIQGITPTLRSTMWEQLGTRFGMFSLTETPDNPTMWAYYADNHRGFVFAFDEKHSFFNRRRGPNDEFYHLRKVLYSPPPGGRTLLDLNGTDFFLRKGEEWSHEREWRILIPLTSADRVIGEGPDAVHLFRMPPDCITQVVVGARANQRDIDDLIQVSQSPEFKHLKLQRVDLDERAQVVGIVPM